MFRYGAASDQLVVGDWNADRRDTFGVRRGNEYYLTNREGGAAEVVARFGSAGDIVIVGDWNRDNRDSLGVRRGNEYHLANAIAGGRTDVVNRYGAADDTSYVGDWNGDGIDTVAVRRPVGPPRTYGGNATYSVGGTIAPGLYKGSVGSEAGCYWERASDFSDEFESVIANNFVPGPTSPIYVEIKGTDAKFETSDCGAWTEARSTDAPRYLTIDDGEYRVAKDMASGLYTAPGGDECYWETATSFDHEFDSIIANDYGTTSPIVDVSDAFGFTSSGCGAWTQLPAGSPTPAKDPADRKAFEQHRSSALASR